MVENVNKSNRDKKERKDINLKDIEDKTKCIIKNVEIPDIEHLKLPEELKKRIKSANYSELREIEKELGIDIDDSLIKTKNEEIDKSRRPVKRFEHNEISEGLSGYNDTVNIEKEITESSIDGRCEINIAEDLMSATLNLYPSRGNGKPLTFEEVKMVLNSKGIVYGVNYDMIKKLISNVEESKSEKIGIIIAEGTPSKEGQDGEIEFCFSESEDVLNREVESEGNSSIY